MVSLRLPLRVAEGDDEVGVSVDGDLQVRAVAVVFARVGEAVVAGRDEGAVDDRDLVDPTPVYRCQGEQRAEGVDDSVRGRVRHPEQRTDLRIASGSSASTRLPAAPDRRGQVTTAGLVVRPRSRPRRARRPA